VENLSMFGAKPVEILLMKIIPTPRSAADQPLLARGRRLRDPLRLIAPRDCVESTPLFNLSRKIKTT
jgi:hypothetical protein